MMSRHAQERCTEPGWVAVAWPMSEWLCTTKSAIRWVVRMGCLMHRCMRCCFRTRSRTTSHLHPTPTRLSANCLGPRSRLSLSSSSLADCSFHGHCVSSECRKPESNRRQTWPREIPTPTLDPSNAKQSAECSRGRGRATCHPPCPKSWPMPDFDETTITAAVIDRVRNAPDPRIREISEALVRHLHQFAREVRLTESEWEWGIRFLTEVGQMCSGTRQEFILLSDTLGVSMLVDAINHRFPQGATETTVFGPFYVPPPAFSHGEAINGHLTGRPMYIGGRVADASGAPLAGATVDIWH